MDLYDRLLDKTAKMVVVGLGYVGLPIAISFAKKLSVIGYDNNDRKIDSYISGYDSTREVGDEIIRQSTMEFTSDEKKISEAKFIIVAVPTPVNEAKIPDLSTLENATETVGRNLKRGSIVVFESTVYPGVTEDVCIPILENISGMKSGVDFTVGYSPERINPGDKEHRLETIVKVVSATDEVTLELISKVYEIVVEAGVYRATSIKIAEAAKVIENAQRDINIAFMNELSRIFNMMEIDTKEVLKAANTKWNFLNFTPGLVGGHCIGIDPYYLTYRASILGYQPQVILAGRSINDGMGKYIAENAIKLLIKANIPVKKSKIAILGFTFKENCPDIRNTRVIDIVSELKEYGVHPLVVDPEADADEVKAEYNIDYGTMADLYDLDAVIVAVGHDQFHSLKLEDFNRMYGKRSSELKVLIDVKGIFSRHDYEADGYLYWRL